MKSPSPHTAGLTKMQAPVQAVVTTIRLWKELLVLFLVTVRAPPVL